MSNTNLSVNKSVIKKVFNSQKQNYLFTRAGSLAFAMMISLFPIVALVAWLGTLDNNIIQSLFKLQDLHRFVPDQLLKVIQSEVDYRSTLTYTGHWTNTLIHTFIFIASGGSAARSLIGTLRTIANAEMKRRLINTYARSLIIVIFFVMIILLFPITITPIILLNYCLSKIISSDWLHHFIQLFFSIIYLSIILNIIYKWVLIGCKYDKIGGFVGALFASIMIALFSLLMSYVTKHDPTMVSEYGSYGIIRNILIWLYGSAYFVLLGAQVNQVIDQNQ